jgi:hypothetical protein
LIKSAYCASGELKFGYGELTIILAGDNKLTILSTYFVVAIFVLPSKLAWVEEYVALVAKVEDVAVTAVVAEPAVVA